MRRQSSDISLSPTKSLLIQPQIHNTPPKNTENTKNNSFAKSFNFDTTEPSLEPPSFNTKFEQLRANSRADENRVVSKRFDRSKLPVFEEVSKPEKRVSSQELSVNPRKKLHEINTENHSSSYLQQAGHLLSGLLGNKKNN